MNEYASWIIFERTSKHIETSPRNRPWSLFELWYDIMGTGREVLKPTAQNVAQTKAMGNHEPMAIPWPCGETRLLLPRWPMP